MKENFFCDGTKELKVQCIPMQAIIVIPIIKL